MTLKDSNHNVRSISGFAGDASKLVIGTAIAQGISLLCAPLLTRLYGPEAFGLLALFISMTSILGVVACLRYELAIMLPESDSEAASLLAISLLSAISVSILTIPLIWLYGECVLRWLNAARLAPYLWLIPVAVFISGVFLALNLWHSRNRRYSSLSAARVANTAVTNAVNIGAGYGGYAVAGTMIGASVGGQALATAVLGWKVWREDSCVFLSALRNHSLLSGIRKYIRFPVYSTWSALLNILSSQLPIFILAMYFSQVVVGYYALSFRILSVPMTFIGSAIAQVFLQRAAQAKHDGTLPEMITKTFQRLLLLAGFPFFLFAVIGPEVFMVVFGREWAEAGVYTQILSPWLFFVFLGSPMSSLNSVLGLQKADLIFNLILMVSRICSLVVGGIMGDVHLALILFAASGAVMWGQFSYYLIAKSGAHPLHFVKQAVLELMMAFIFVLPVIIAKWFAGASTLLILAVAAIVIILYYVRVLYQDEEMRFLLTHCRRKGAI